MNLLSTQFPAKTSERGLTQNINGIFTILYESNNGAIIVPHDFTAMQELAAGTFWLDGGDTCKHTSKQEFEGIIKEKPIVVYLINDGDKVEKFAYGFGNITEFEDNNACNFSYCNSEAGDINNLYDEAINNASPDLTNYIKACAHCHHVEKYDDGFQRDVIIDDSGELSSVAKQVISGIKNEDYLPCDMFGASVLDPTNPKETVHNFGNPELQTEIAFLLEADRVFDYSSKPLKYIDPNYMPEEDYCNISLMLIAQNAHNIKNVAPVAFKNIEFISKLLDLASTEQPANQQQILRHVHRIPALYGHISGNFQNMKQHIREAANQSISYATLET